MVNKAAELLLQKTDMDWVLGSDRMGHAMYRVAAKAVSAPLDFGVSRATKGLFPDPAPIPEGKPLTKALAEFKIRKISNSNELLERIFDVAVAIVIFIPATLIAKEVATAMGFAELTMVTTPLFTLLQQEAASLIASEFFNHLICLMIAYIEQ